MLNEPMIPVPFLCNVCNGRITLSIELIERLLDTEQKLEEEFDDEIDKLIRGEKVEFDFGHSPMPILIQGKNLIVVGWCRKCKQAVACPIDNEMFLFLTSNPHGGMRN